MQTYSSFTLPLQDGSIGLVVVFRGFEEELAIMQFLDELDIHLNPDMSQTVH